MTFLTVVIGAIPSSGLVDNAPLLVKIVGMAIAALSTLNYTVHRTSLKRAYVAAGGVIAAPASQRVHTLVGIFALAGSLAMVTVGGCKSVSPVIKSGGDTFLQCGKQDLMQAAGDTSLLATVAGDLFQKNYAALIADLVAKFGGDAVGCATLAIDAVVSSANQVVAAGSGSGSAISVPLLASSTPPLLGSRAKEMISKYSWKAAPGASRPAAK